MNDYHILVKNVDGTNIGEFTYFTRLRFGKRLNDYGTAEIHVPINDTRLNSLVALRRNTLWIYRGTELVWSGEMALRRGALDDKGSGLVELHCFDWAELLRHRYTAALKVYTNIDAGAIAWDLINETQTQDNGDFGITEGIIEETFTRDREYKNDQILDSIINLTNVLAGFDFEITNNRVFNVYTSKSIDRTDSVVFEYGRNVKTCTITEDFTTPVNRGIILGESTENTEELQRVESNDVDSQVLYKVRESMQNEMNVSEMDTLTKKGMELIRKYDTPLIKIEHDLIAGSPNITQFDNGDLIRLKVEKNIYHVDDPYRVFEWEVVYDADNVEKLTTVLGRFTI